MVRRTAAAEEGFRSLARPQQRLARGRVENLVYVGLLDAALRDGFHHLDLLLDGELACARQDAEIGRERGHLGHHHLLARRRHDLSLISYHIMSTNKRRFSDHHHSLHRVHVCARFERLELETQSSWQYSIF